MQISNFGKALRQIAATAILALPALHAAQAGEPRRPALMAERLLLSDAQDEAPDGRLWTKLLLGLGLPDIEPSEAKAYGDGCRYVSALTTFSALRKENLDEAYVRDWARNQERVFAACRDRAKDAPAPEKPLGRRPPARAESDFLYQLGSWHFYRGEHREAMAAYLKVEGTRSAPMRPQAAYMVIRCLAHLGDGNAAYARIEDIEKDASLAEVHAITSSYRFVLMSPSRSFDIPELDGDLFKRHLQWLQQVVEVDPNKAMDKERARGDHADAMEQLRAYFPMFAPGGAVDWWLEPGPTAGPRMAAVQELASRHEMVAWMQAQWDLNVLAQDWLWALHLPAHAYWGQNHRLVEHHLARWKSTGNGAWLQLALSRVHPQDPLATVLLREAEPYFSRPWKTETQEYKEWLLAMWSHSVRVSLGQQNVGAALALIAEHSDFESLADSWRHSYRIVRRFEDGYQKVVEHALRWLVYVGHHDAARQLLAQQKPMRGKFRHWDTLLAPTLDAALSAVRRQPFDESPTADRQLWQEWLNSASSPALERIASDELLPLSERAMAGRTLVARSILREADGETLNRVAALAAKLNPELREELLAAMAGHERPKQIELLLRNPRLRPGVLVEYAPEPSGGTPALSLGAIDSQNPNDNNWWCRYDASAFKARIFKVARIVPQPTQLMALEVTADELIEALQRQRELLASHPLQQWVDDAELSALQAVPSGPEYLSRAVNRWERDAPPAATEDERSRRAANLHRAVRSTRYGCRVNGPHGAYSKESFSLLHSRYPDQPWAKATPYWFD